MSEPDPQTVYVLDADCYSDRFIAGVYATPEAAMLRASPLPFGECAT